MKTIYDIIKSRGCYGIRCKRGWCPIYLVCMSTTRDISMSDVSVPNGRITDKFVVSRQRGKEFADFRSGLPLEDMLTDALLLLLRERNLRRLLLGDGLLGRCHFLRGLLGRRFRGGCFGLRGYGGFGLRIEIEHYDLH